MSKNLRMKLILKLLCLMLATPLLFVACTHTDTPDNTDSSTDTQSDPATTPEETTAPTEDTEEIEDTFDPAADTRFGTAVNVDCDAIMYMYKANGREWGDAEQTCIDWFNAHYKDADITDILYNIDTVVPTESRKEWWDWYLEAQKTGEKLDETTEDFGKITNELYNELQVNPYDIWIDLCRQNNINPWLSFRMNDVHAQLFGYKCQDFYYTAKENGWLIGEQSGRDIAFAQCYDYSVPQVREFYTTYIDEVLGDFDVYGIELDFQRQIYCFKNESASNCQYMDLLLEEVNRIVEKYEQQYGHEIKVMVRLTRDLEQNKTFGFDVVNWAKNDWVDVLVPTSNYGQSDSRMPIAAWKEALQAYEKVEVYAGLESHVFRVGSDKYTQTILSLAGYTSMYLQQGADKIYLYNLFNATPTTFKVCASLEAALKASKRVYVVVGQDDAPIGVEKDKPIPLYVRGGTTETVTIAHGRLNANKDTYIYIGISKMAFSEEDLADANLKITYNGVACEYKGETIKAFVKQEGDFGYMLSFKVPKSAYKMAECGEIAISTDNTLRVMYLELMNGPPALG